MGQKNPLQPPARDQPGAGMVYSSAGRLTSPAEARACSSVIHEIAIIQETVTGKPALDPDVNSQFFQADPAMLREGRVKP